MRCNRNWEFKLENSEADVWKIKYRSQNLVVVVVWSLMLWVEEIDIWYITL